jgi:hypothetical protein
MISAGRGLFPSRNAELSTPSMGRSSGTRLCSPANAASVGIKSTALSISSLTAPAFTTPGQSTIAGARMPPSKPDPKWPRQGPFEPPMDVDRPAGLSLLHTTIVFFAMPAWSIASRTYGAVAIRSGPEPLSFCYVRGMRNSGALTSLALVVAMLSAAHGSVGMRDSDDPGVPPQAARLPFESLGEAKTFEDLSRYGLVAPGAHNHKAGSQIVLLALKVTSLFKGDWVMAHGLLGVSMLNVEVTEGIGYRSLFLKYALAGNKLATVYETNNNGLLVDAVSRLPKKTSSIIARREAALYCLADQLFSRYRYNDEGNYAQMYQPSERPKSNASLRGCVAAAIQVFRELKKKGFEDKTLKDALGLAYASLDRDGAMALPAEAFTLGPAQVFRDALDAALVSLTKWPQDSAYLLDRFTGQMEARGLTVNDEMQLPSSQEALDALLKIVADDLALIDRGSAPEGKRSK